MRRVWTWRQIDAPADTVWQVLTDLEQWRDWGPSLRGATVDGGGGLVAGATGTVTTFIGVDLRFEITEMVEGRRWSWKVAGVPATSHAVEALDAGRCRAGFGVPVPALPYLAVCALALRHIERLAGGSPGRS